MRDQAEAGDKAARIAGRLIAVRCELLTFSGLLIEGMIRECGDIFVMVQVERSASCKKGWLMRL